MVDIASVSAALSGISNAIASAKYLQGVAGAFEKAEAKLQIANLLEALADSKVAVVELRELLNEKEQVIGLLRKDLENREDTIRHNGVYWQKGSLGRPLREPYCPRCLEADQKLIHLQRLPNAYMHCPMRECGFGVDADQIGLPGPQQRPELDEDQCY